MTLKSLCSQEETSPEVLALENHAQVELMRHLFAKHKIPFEGQKQEEQKRTGKVAEEIGKVFRKLLEADPALEEEICAEEKEYEKLLPKTKMQLVERIEKGMHFQQCAAEASAIHGFES